MAPRWSKRDDEAIMDAAEARGGSAWPATVALPDRGPISRKDAKDRFSRLGKRKAQPKVEQSSEHHDNTLCILPHERKYRRTPMRDRAAAVDVPFAPTPQHLRALVAQGKGGDVIAARRAIHLHQRVRANKISRAEQRKFWRERHELVTQQLQEEFQKF